MSPIPRLEQLRRLSREHLLAEIRRATGNPQVLLWEMVAYGAQYRPVRAGPESAKALGVNEGTVIGYVVDVPLGMGQAINCLTGIEVIQNDPPFADPFKNDASARPQSPAGDVSKMKDPRGGEEQAELECQVMGGIVTGGKFHVIAMNHGPSTSPSHVLRVSAEVRTGYVDFYGGKGETATNERYYHPPDEDLKRNITYPKQRDNPPLQQIGPQKSQGQYVWEFTIGPLPPRAGTKIYIPYYLDRDKGKKAGVRVEASLEGKLPDPGGLRNSHADNLLIEG